MSLRLNFLKISSLYLSTKNVKPFLAAYVISIETNLEFSTLLISLYKTIIKESEKYLKYTI